jgi:hypothetical protein
MRLPRFARNDTHYSVFGRAGKGTCEASLAFTTRFIYITSMLVLVLKVIYFAFLVVLFYFELAWTVTVAFFRVTFFGL